MRNSGQQVYDAMGQWMVGMLAVSIIGTIISLYVLYLIIRWGVRDGMRDAQRELREGREPARHRAANTAHLPDMRAD